MGVCALLLAFAAQKGFAQTERDGLDEATRLLRNLSTPSNATPAKPVPAPVAAPVATTPAVSNSSPREAVTPAASKNYVLSPNDIVEVKVFDEEKLTTNTRLSEEGVIGFPLIGNVKIGGMTLDQAADLIRELLDKDYIINPQVNVSVVEFTKRRFTILGQVQKPGSYEIPDAQSLNLLQAISMAGGYTRIASPGKVTVQRVEKGEKLIFNLDAKAMAKSKETKLFEVRANDTITVSESIF